MDLAITSRARALSLVAVIALAGCQTLPEETAPDIVEAPVVEPQECPVCPVVECPVLECPEPQVREKVVTKYLPAPVVTDATPIIGAVEWAYVEPGDLFFEARIDTGAETSSIHAEDIQLLEKDGKRYVRFSLQNPESGEKIQLERRLHRRIVVKQNVDAPPDRRYVVRMWVTLGATRTWLDVSLSDRDDFEFELLLGRNMLMDDFVVDVSKKHTQPKKPPEPK